MECTKSLKKVEGTSPFLYKELQGAPCNFVNMLLLESLNYTKIIKEHSKISHIKNTPQTTYKTDVE